MRAGRGERSGVAPPFDRGRAGVKGSSDQDTQGEGFSGLRRGSRRARNASLLVFLAVARVAELAQEPEVFLAELGAARLASDGAVQEAREGRAQEGHALRGRRREVVLLARIPGEVEELGALGVALDVQLLVAEARHAPDVDHLLAID